MRCGREVESGKYIDQYGLCIDCFLKYNNIFRIKPILRITVCPRCGSWRLSGEWMEPLSLNNIIRRVFFKEYHKYVEDFIEILEAEIVDEPVHVYRNRYYVKMKFLVLINNVVEREIATTIEFFLDKQLCHKCIAFAGKSCKALIQIRSENGYLSDKNRYLVKQLLSDPMFSSDIIEINENRYGIDIKFYTSTIARKAVNILSRKTGAKIIESFKPVKYDPRHGNWKGIVTFSVRLPAIRKDDLVEYKGRPAIVRKVDNNGISIEFLDDGTLLTIGYHQYWNGVLKKPSYIFFTRKYKVIAYDSSTLYLLDEETGSLRDYPLNKHTLGFNEGDIVYIVKYKDKEYLVKK